jgi:hypothetical protein
MQTMAGIKRVGYRTILASLLLAPAACMPAVTAAIGPSLAVGSTAATGKTPVDHVVSWVRNKDCSVLRDRQGLTYCREDERTPPVRVRCYRTLGDVACYDRPDPYDARQRALASDPPSPPTLPQAADTAEPDAVDDQSEATASLR